MRISDWSSDVCSADLDGVWISLAPRDQSLSRAAMLADGGPSADQPLWGIPFAVKDNIDAAGLPTTAACPAFSYQPDASATVVKKLLAAGAILIGQTNLAQFATGLVGVRSHYGVARTPVKDRKDGGWGKKGEGSV